MAGLATAFGSGAMTNSISEVEEVEVALVIGSNTTENHPIIGAALRRGVLHHGAKLIVADPREIGLTQDACLWLRQRPGTDLALLNAMLHVIFSQGLEDTAYIQQKTENLDAAKDAVKDCTPAWAQEITGVPAEKIIQAAQLYAGAKSAAIYYAMGITQHTRGTDNVKALANLALACGHLGQRGTGVNPLRGQNNVQGACDMGALPGDLPGYQKTADQAVRQKFAQAWGVKRLPAKAGITLTESMGAAQDGAVTGMIIMGENPMLSDPDQKHVKAALKKLELLVVLDIFPTETTELAHVVLPAACWAEKEGTFTNTERRVQRVRQAVDAPGLAKPDWWILNELGKRLGLKTSFTSPKQINQEIRQVTPAYCGITYPRLEKLGGLQWPCPTTNHPGTCVLHEGGCKRGKGFFSPVHFAGPAEPVSKAYPFTLTTGRHRYHYHTASMTKRSAGLSDLAPVCQVEINPIDAANLGLAENDAVQVRSRRGRITVFAHLTQRVAPGVVFIPFHYAEAAVNKLTQNALDPIAKIPELKVCAVKLEKAA